MVVSDALIQNIKNVMNDISRYYSDIMGDNSNTTKFLCTRIIREKLIDLSRLHELVEKEYQHG